MTTPHRTIGLGLVFVLLAGTLALGLALKAPCASGDWADGRQYERFCYTDIVPLLGAEQLAGGRLPYLDPCGETDGNCDEYPVLSMYTMRVAAWASSTTSGFFAANVVLLTIAAFVVALCLYLLVGSRALYFVLSPTLLVYAYINWDLIAVAFAAVATLAFFNRRNVASGVAVGLGAAAKLYPALLAIPFVADRFHRREPDGGIHLAWAAVGAWLAVNVPFMLLAPTGWWEFFRFNRERPADWDSLWFIGCHRLTGNLYCGATNAVNLGSLALFAGSVTFVWWLKARRDPGFGRWALAFPILVLFLLTNKVYSPQYGLWLLPWFALALPSPWLFAAFSVADVGVFLTRFSWFGEYGGYGGVPIGTFEIAVLVRAVVLVVCLVAWVRRPTSEIARGAHPTGSAETPAAEGAPA